MTTPEPRVEPDSVYAPDPPPDHEAVAEIRERVREAVYIASEQGSDHYEGHLGRYTDLLQVCGQILEAGRPERVNWVTANALGGNYSAAAREIERIEAQHFGRNFPHPGPPTFFRDPTLASLKAWLQRRNSPFHEQEDGR